MKGNFVMVDTRNIFKIEETVVAPKLFTIGKTVGANPAVEKPIMKIGQTVSHTFTTTPSVIGVSKVNQQLQVALKGGQSVNLPKGFGYEEISRLVKEAESGRISIPIGSHGAVVDNGMVTLYAANTAPVNISLVNLKQIAETAASRNQNSSDILSMAIK